MSCKNNFCKGSVSTDKEVLRKLYRRKRLALQPQEISRLSEQILLRFKEGFPIEAGDKVHCFLPIATLNEVDTLPLISWLFQNKVRIFVPKVIGDAMISVELFPKTALHLSLLHIPEPDSLVDSGILDFRYVITPLLYCDPSGNRIGYGKGFYDRFFADAAADSIKVGLNYFPPAEVISATFQSDVPLDYLVTPTAVLSFGELEKKSTK